LPIILKKLKKAGQVMRFLEKLSKFLNGLGETKLILAGWALFLVYAALALFSLYASLISGISIFLILLFIASSCMTYLHFLMLRLYLQRKGKKEVAL
jgi:hypothetical protein